jgi:N-methylhydantoinase B
VIIDPVDLQVMRHALESVADEMHHALVRTARSTNIKDRQDTSSAIYAVDGRVIAQSEFATPLHLGTNSHLVPYLLQNYDWSKLGEGDGLVTNCPYPIGPGHLNDIAVVSPILRDGQLVAIAANQAHHVDVGGYAPGSMPFGVTEIYQEGLQIAPVRLFKGWQLDDDLWRLIAANVRSQEEVRGDFEAQITANGLAVRRLNDLMDKVGTDRVHASFDALCDYAERRARSTIAAIPDGRYSFDDVVEGDGISTDLIPIAVDIDVRGDEATFDFSRSADAVSGPLNCRLASVSACIYYVLKVLAGSDLPANAGAYRPLQIVLREGSIFGPTYPHAVCNANITTIQRVVDVIFGALRDTLPDRIGAASSGTMSLINIGTRTRNGAGFTNLVETYAGGQGAFESQPGMDGVQTHMTNTRNAPVEVIERTYPLRVIGYGLRDASGGRGRQPGGRGVWRHYRVESDAHVTVSGDRTAVPPWGVDGGGPGRPARYRTRSSAAAPWRRLPCKVSFHLPAGGELLIETPGGGGNGTRVQRP